MALIEIERGERKGVVSVEKFSATGEPLGWASELVDEQLPNIVVADYNPAPLVSTTVRVDN